MAIQIIRIRAFMACLVGDPNGMCPLDGTLSAYGDYGPDELTKDLTGTSNSSDNGSFSFGAFSFVAGEAISPTEGGFGAAESIPIAGWDSSDGLFQSSLDALGGGVGTHSDNFSFFGATGPTSGGPLEIAGFQEANVGPDNGLFGMAVGGGIFETNNNGLGIYGHIGVTSLGENAYVGVGAYVNLPAQQPGGFPWPGGVTYQGQGYAIGMGGY